MSDEGKTFVANVISGELVNIPDTFADHHDVRQGDTVELKVVSHKRDGQELNQPTEPSN